MDKFITQYDLKLINVFTNFHCIGFILIFIGAFVGIDVGVLYIPAIVLSVGFLLISFYLGIVPSFLKACNENKTDKADILKKFGFYIYVFLFIWFFIELFGGVYLLSVLYVH
jgi:ribose/xylose/arabinose/galactoside ABC-type transport system permease subunit